MRLSLSVSSNTIWNREVERSKMTLDRFVLLSLLLLLTVCQVLSAKEKDEEAGPQERLDPLKHREARDPVDLKAREEHYRRRLKEFNGCPPPQPPSPEGLPTVPDSFTTNIEISFQEFDARKVIYGQEMYDGVNQRGILNYQFAQLMIDERPDLKTENIRYDVNKDEALFILENDGCPVAGQEDCHSSRNCTAGTLDDLSNELEQLFGVIAHPGHSGFIGAAGILEFGPQFNYTLQMMDMCHGLECDIYETCIYIPEENATLLYTYYWSRPDWYLGNNDQQVPIAVEIYGNHKIDQHTTKGIMRRYDFFNYMREVRPSKYELEAPADVYCYGRKSVLDPPKAAQQFYLRSETIGGVDVPVDPTKNDTEYRKYRVIFPKTEYYDYPMRISRQDFVPIFAFGNERRFENMTSLVQDFNQGLAYVVQPRQRVCEITKITNVTHGDVEVNPDGSIYMKNPWHYEDLDQPLQHNGNHWSRGLDTGVWLGIKEFEDVDPYTYVWYFASPLTHEIVGFSSADGTPPNIDIPTVDHVPVKMEKYLSFVPNLAPLTYNIYDYQTVPHVHVHDISLCYTPATMRNLAFNMPENTINKTRHKVENLKYGIVFTLSDVGMVSPLRINRLELKEIPGAVQVTFTLLEKPDLVGSVEMAGHENTMQEAYNAINAKLDNSQLIVEIDLSINPEKPDVVQLVAVPNTMKDVQRDDGIVTSSETTEGYAPGDMAILGVSMAIIGAFIGAAARRVFTKYHS